MFDSGQRSTTYWNWVVNFFMRGL